MPPTEEDRTVTRLDTRIDRVEITVQEQKKQTDEAIANLATQVTILVTTLQQWPHYTQPCETMKEHLKEHNDWRKSIVQWIGGIVAALIIAYVSFMSGEYIRMKNLESVKAMNEAQMGVQTHTQTQTETIKTSN
jgi:hypothetical protein